MRNTILFTAFVLAAAVAFPAQAEMPARSESIGTAGLNLGTTAGRSRLRRRVAAAIETVCGSYAGTSFEEQDGIGRCRRDAWASVTIQLAVLQARRRGITQAAASTR